MSEGENNRAVVEDPATEEVRTADDGGYLREEGDGVEAGTGREEVEPSGPVAAEKQTSQFDGWVVKEKKRRRTGG